jgi:TRAP-type C4-dicarboxylate transport system permease small subunit
MGGKLMKKTLDIVKSITGKMCIVGMLSMLIMMVMVTIDTIIRKTPIGGITDSMDMTQLLLGLIIYSGMAFLESNRGHVRVDMFLLMMPMKIRKVVEGIVYLLSTVILGITVYAYIINIGPDYRSRAGTQVLRIPQWPFKLVVAIGIFLFAVTMLVHTIALFRGDIATEAPEEEDAGGDAETA